MRCLFDDDYRLWKLIFGWRISWITYSSAASRCSDVTNCCRPGLSLDRTSRSRITYIGSARVFNCSVWEWKRRILRVMYITAALWRNGYHFTIYQVTILSVLVTFQTSATAHGHWGAMQSTRHTANSSRPNFSGVAPGGI